MDCLTTRGTGRPVKVNVDRMKTHITITAHGRQETPTRCLLVVSGRFVLSDAAWCFTPRLQMSRLPQAKKKYCWHEVLEIPKA